MFATEDPMSKYQPIRTMKWIINELEDGTLIGFNSDTFKPYQLIPLDLEEAQDKLAMVRSKQNV